MIDTVLEYLSGSPVAQVCAAIAAGIFLLLMAALPKDGNGGYTREDYERERREEAANRREEAQLRRTWAERDSEQKRREDERIQNLADHHPMGP